MKERTAEFHSVEWTISQEWVRGKITCVAPEGASCRLVCPESCEEWAPDHHHPLVDAGYCNVVEFIENGDSIEAAYTGPQTALRGGPIEYEWQGDWYAWHYADPHPENDEPHEEPHFHPSSGACDCTCAACDDGEDLCLCPDCNRKCGQQHPPENVEGRCAECGKDVGRFSPICRACLGPE